MPKREKRPAVKPFNLDDAVFAYVSLCCNEVAKKPAVSQVAKEHPCTEKTVDGHDRKGGEGTLGKFRCSKCGKRCKVRVDRRDKKTA